MSIFYRHDLLFVNFVKNLTQILLSWS